MKPLATLLLVLGACVLTFAWGCQSNSGGGTTAPPTENVDSSVQGSGDADTNGVDTDGLDTTPDGDATELTEEQEQALETTMTSITNLGGVFAALGAADLSSLGTGSFGGGDLITCPAMSYEAGAFTIDYGDGCSPVLYPDQTFSGSITGQIDFATMTLTMTFNDFNYDDLAYTNGTMVATVSQEDGVITIEAEIDLTYTVDGVGVHDEGDVTVQIDLNTGEMLIPYADLRTTDQTGEVYAVTLESVHIDLIEVLPDAGKATITLGANTPSAVIMEVTFTENTPVDGEVIVSINGSPPIKMSLDEVEV